MQNATFTLLLSTLIRDLLHSTRSARALLASHPFPVRPMKLTVRRPTPRSPRPPRPSRHARPAALRAAPPGPLAGSGLRAPSPAGIAVHTVPSSVTARRVGSAGGGAGCRAQLHF